MKDSDFLIILAEPALLKPCFFRNKVNTALASSFSAATRFGGTVLKLKEPSSSDSAVNYQSKLRALIDILLFFVMLQ